MEFEIVFSCMSLIRNLCLHGHSRIDSIDDAIVHESKRADRVQNRIAPQTSPDLSYGSCASSAAFHSRTADFQNSTHLF